jgi:epsilon-lactone hydrolase
MQSAKHKSTTGNDPWSFVHPLDSEDAAAMTADAEACYRGLVGRGIRNIALSGDSAGGNLALVLLSIAVAKCASGGTLPVGAVTLSPVTDLALSGTSYETHAEADPYFLKSQVAALVRSYLGDADWENPPASPLYGDLTALPPIRVHVGDDEVLLDDSLRYVQRAVAVDVDATRDVWLVMAHGFTNIVGRMHAANQALDAIGAFLRERLGGASVASESGQLMESKRNPLKTCTAVAVATIPFQVSLCGAYQQRTSNQGE